MPYKINIRQADGSITIKPLEECAAQGLLVLHHPDAIKIYEDQEVANALRTIYTLLGLRTDWETWNMDSTPVGIPWAGTPTVNNSAWNNLFASTNPKIQQALTKHASDTKERKPTKARHKHNTINELGIFRYGDLFMHAFPRAHRVPGEGLIRIAQTVMHKGTPHTIHPFFTDQRALVDTEALMEQVTDIIVESHTKDGEPFFPPTAASSALPPTPNFGGGMARHITLLASDPGILGLSAAYMAQLEIDFPGYDFGFNRPINLRNAMGYIELHRDPATEFQGQAARPTKKRAEATTREVGDRPIKRPCKKQSWHTDLAVIQATSKPACAVILAPVSNTSQLHVAPMGQDLMRGLKELVSENGSLNEDPDANYLDPNISRALHLSAPPNTNLSMGIPLEQVTLQMSRGTSCALLPCTPHAGAGLAERDTHRNLRIHIILYPSPPPFPTSADQSSAAYISPPILHQFSGKIPQHTHHLHHCTSSPVPI
jgi:hypothetical protein